MIATTRQCLTPHELQSLVRGQFAADKLDAAIEHLDQCQSCQSSVLELDSDSANSPPHQRLQLTDDAVESACQIAMSRLIAAPPRLTQAENSLIADRKLGPYTLLGAIGAGGMGVVYLAEHQRLRRKCAIKFLPRTRVNNTGWLERFNREMTTVAALEHSNIVRATDAGHEDGWHYLVMEYLDGLDVGKLATRIHQLEIADACQIVGQAALGLAHVHQRGLIHRDIKPSNIMVTRSGDVKLLDLGLVLAGDDPLETHDRLTAAGHMMGTMPYMSPEQLLDSRHVDPASDIYSLGATLYRLLAGRVPHRDRHGIAAQILAITNEPPPPLSDVIPNLEADLSALVTAMLARDPKARPTAEQVAETLTRWSSQARLGNLVRTAEALPDNEADDIHSWSMLTSMAPASPPRRRLPRLLIAGIAGFALLIAGVIFKIQTERGELVIESEADDVTIMVKQGETLVESLQVQRGDDNRLQLRQGTYTIEIEGAESGVRLAQNRVVIEAKHEATVALKSDAKQAPPEPKANVTPSTSEQLPELVELRDAMFFRPLHFNGSVSDSTYNPPSKLRFQVVKTPLYVGWEVVDEQGRTVRLFADTNFDRKLDRWCYFRDGQEIYRDSDTDFNGAIDLALIINDSEIQWGLDSDEDGKIEKWIQHRREAQEETPAITETHQTAQPSVIFKRTFQGHPYAYWFDILNREQDAATLANTMQAIEILSRDTPQRAEAAEATMRLADRLGGMVIGGSDEPSGIYMESMRKSFPHYLPEPGMEVVQRALQSDNLKSRMAAAWMLRDFLDGVLGDTAFSQRQRISAEYFQKLTSGNEREQAMFDELLQAIGNAVAPDIDNLWSEEGNMNSYLFNSASRLLQLAARDHEIPEWMQAYVRTEVNRAASTFSQTSEAEKDFSGRPDWLLDEMFLRTAIDMHQNDKMKLPIDWLAANVMHPGVFTGHKQDITLMQRVATEFVGGADALQQSARQRIARIVNNDHSAESQFRGSGNGRGGFGMVGMHEDPRSFMLRDRETWEYIVKLLGEDTSARANESLAILRLLRDRKLESSSSRFLPTELEPAVDAAIEKLESKLEPQAK